TELCSQADRVQSSRPSGTGLSRHARHVAILVRIFAACEDPEGHFFYQRPRVDRGTLPLDESDGADRKSTRLNSSHVKISYAVFCLKKKKKRQKIEQADQL